MSIMEYNLYNQSSTPKQSRTARSPAAANEKRGGSRSTTPKQTGPDRLSEKQKQNYDDELTRDRPRTPRIAITNNNSPHKTQNSPHPAPTRSNTPNNTPKELKNSDLSKNTNRDPRSKHPNESPKQKSLQTVFSGNKTDGVFPVYNSKKTFSDDEIREMLSDGYITIHASLWDYIPKGAHIRYQRRDNGTNQSRGERFKSGGFVKQHTTTAEEKKIIILENKPNGRRGENGYSSFPVKLEDVEQIWKKYDTNTFIETHLIYNSLAEKKKQIEELTKRVTTLENILKNVIVNSK